MTPQPRTAAGRALLNDFSGDYWDGPQSRADLADTILAIEAEAVGLGGETALRLHASVHKVQDRERAEAAAPLRAALERFVTFHSGHVLPAELVNTMTMARAALAQPEREAGE